MTDLTAFENSKAQTALYRAQWERSDDYGQARGADWNRLRLSETTELTIQRRGYGAGVYRIRLCGRLLGTTRDKSEDRRRAKALAMLRAWIDALPEDVVFAGRTSR